MERASEIIFASPSPRWCGPNVPALAVAIVVGVAAFLLARRIGFSFRFERARRADRLVAQGIAVKKAGKRYVDVYSSVHFAGSPFTGGFLRPYICIPEKALSCLSKSELDAVVAHELGHVRNLDLPAAIATFLLGDIFWFLPGYRWLAAKLHRLRELTADRSAMACGIDPISLASALLKLRDHPSTDNHLAPCSAFFRERALLNERVDALLGNSTDPSPRFGWRFAIARWGIAAWILFATLATTIGGNHAKSFEVSQRETKAAIIRLTQADSAKV